MKYFYLTLFSLLFCISSYAQKCVIQIDSFYSIKLKTGKIYTAKYDENKEKLIFSGIENDSFLFGSHKIYYGDLELKNPKRRAGLDVVFIPLSLASCIAMSAFPVSYMIGYFTTDINKIFTGIVAFAVQGVLFAVSRTYISKNPKWLEINKLNKLKYVVD